MKVYELMSVLAKRPASADVEVHGSGLLMSSIEKVDEDSSDDGIVALWLNDPQIVEDKN